MTIVKLGIRGEGWGCRRGRSYSSRSAVKDHKSTLGMNVASKRRKEWRCVQLRWRGIFHPGLASSNNPSRLRLSLRAVAPLPKSTPWVYSNTGNKLVQRFAQHCCFISGIVMLLVLPFARSSCCATVLCHQLVAQQFVQPITKRNILRSGDKLLARLLKRAVLQCVTKSRCMNLLPV